MKRETDILLDNNYDVAFLGGDFMTGLSLTQEVDLIIGLNQGELKEDPLLGVNIVRFMNATVSEEELRNKVRLHLKRDGKDYNEIKEFIQINSKGQ